ncbi:hypothetical protein U9M48_040463 [Paspalum notatum var. saurae]|uniref:non-specific serine/threonine protein kinase n=1 Tax=Paspalum notatum var. saurae TaxID=547442 RepID=A0AAQ3XDS4_PASNO
MTTTTGDGSWCRSHGRLVVLWLLLACSWVAAARAQQTAARTDPVEVAALNTILGRWGLRASPAWNISGEPCSGVAVDTTDVDNNPNINPAIKCDCSYNNNTVCHIIKLKVIALNVVGQIPDELQNFTYLNNLNLKQNYLTGPVPSFIGKFPMQYLSLAFNPLSGTLPKELGNLTSLMSLGISMNNFTGELPSELGNLAKLEQIYFDSSGFSGPFPSTFSKLKNLQILWASDNDFTGKIPDFIGGLTNLEDLRFQGNSFEGPIPESFSNLTKVTSLRIGDIVNGSSSLSFISNLTSLNVLILRNCRISDNLATVNFSNLPGLTLLDLSFNNITGQIPQSILNLDKIGFLFLGNNSLSGSLPDVKSPSLNNLDFSYNQLSGSFPSWATQNNLQLNLVANKFVLGGSNNSILPSGLNCLQQDTPCFLGAPEYSSFAVDCGSNRSMRGSDNTFYETDPTNIGAASYYVTGQTRWGVSNVGKFNEAPNGSYIIYSPQQFQTALDSELFQTARMSPSSLRYYGIGLENGNYTVHLQFAEFAYPDSPTWQSTGRRVFDIYVQGDLKEKNFDIRKTAGGSYLAVYKKYNATVSKNFLEIHLFWAGKGTCFIPTQGYYGPMISALSVTPNFTPSVRNGVPKKKSKAGAIAGIVLGASVLVLAVLAGVFMLVQKRRRVAQQQEELYNMVGRPNVFSNAELKLATDNFSSHNILGEGGYGPVYKGKLPDGRVIAVKQLSQTSHQGKSQFMTEVATISAVQHRNLVKLYGCCIDSNTPLLVYEFHENGSLDRALFGDSGLRLDWPTRFDIILGIARGLTYLHEESSVRIVHRDIKASNVLLDTELTPKISDFGLAKLFDEKKTHVSTKIAGTFGYLAPEYAMRGHLTEKADVFAFGVVALETIAGRSNTDNSMEEDKIYLFEWVWELYERGQALGILDPRVEEFDSEEALRVIGIALLCTQGSPHQRPPMSRVVKMLTGDIEMAEVVTKPSYITEWQRRGGNTSYDLTASSKILLVSVVLQNVYFHAYCFVPLTANSSFAVDSGSNRSMRGSDNTFYEIDPTNLGATSYYVTDKTRWGVSNVGKFNDAPNASYIMYSSEQFHNALDSELFQTARLSPSSLRYYGIGLENGNYSVELQFAEFAYPDNLTWQSTGRRVFDIYLQGDLKEKNFDVRKTAGGKSYTAVYKKYNATVSKNFLEIHLFWAGKGTCCIPTQGYYGPMISALSVSPNFTPTVRNGVPKKKRKAGAIAGITIGASVLGLVALVGIFLLVQKRRRVARQQEELYHMVGRPNVFSNNELKLATDNFSPQNILGEGGYGPGKLPDGRVIAVKKLSQTSNQGKSQFVTEVATISAVQHRNLVKLHGCGIDSNTPLLVYEYHENGSLDRALFGDSGLSLNWPTRFEIILGVARGLTYLHVESSVRIVHRDIKASNVLLDTDLTPKISDFGLAKLFDETKTHVSTKIAGTFGWVFEHEMVCEMGGGSRHGNYGRD